ncbi:MAG: MCE family protein [Bacteroidales bacterium]|nr:MCE family protein [Bacteroidales bacterium]
MKTSRIILIGLVIVVAITVLVLGLNYLKGHNFFKPKNNYIIKYDRIEGLMVSNPVLINGFKVGQITDIRLELGKLEGIIVEIDIDPSITVNDSTLALIYSLDLMGSKGIDLTIGNGLNQLHPGDTLIADIEQDLKDQVSAQMLPLKLKAEDLMVSIEDAMKVVKNLFNKNNVENIEGTLKRLNSTFKTLEHTSTELDSVLTNGRGKLDKIFANVESITSNLKNNNEQIDFILKNLAMVSDSLAKSKLLSTIDNANRTLAQTDSIMQKINNGEGTIGQLINNDTLYYNLENASKSLNNLLIDIKENPKRYIHYSLFDFGKTIVVDEEGLQKEKDKKTKKHAKKAEGETSYRIQIKSSTQPILPNSDEFKGYKGIDAHFIGGKYKYTVGESKSFAAMKNLREGLIDIFPDAFVIEYENDSLLGRIN